MQRRGREGFNECRRRVRDEKGNGGRKGRRGEERTGKTGGGDKSVLKSWSRLIMFNGRMHLKASHPHMSFRGQVTVTWAVRQPDAAALCCNSQSIEKSHDRNHLYLQMR